MMLTLPPIEPAEQANSYDYTIALGDYSYRVVLTWRERCASWYLALYDSADNLLVDGKRLFIGAPILWRHTGRNTINGQLVFLDISGSQEECTFEELGHRCFLCWSETDGAMDWAVESYPVTVAAVP